MFVPVVVTDALLADGDVNQQTAVLIDKRRVDRNDFLRGFDQVCIDCILFSCVLMNYDIV